jgi:ABC-type multidrug transport system ATPase subunit
MTTDSIEINGHWYRAAPGRPVTIGRAQDADVAFFDPRVSHHHATLERTEIGTWQLIDLGGRGGTWLNGRRITRLAVDAAVDVRLGDPLDGAKLHLVPHDDFGRDDGASAKGRASRMPAAARYQWRAAAVRIGRAEDNDVVVADLQASRHHAELRSVGPDSWEIVDQNSHNGTFVDGTRSTRTILADGQRVTIGRTELRFEKGRLDPWVTSPARQQAALQARGLNVDLPGGQRILDDVSFRVEPGQILAVVGPTGSGKSTLLRALTGFRPPDSGTVLFAGRSLYDEFDELRRTIGYVPQDDILHTTLTVRRALSFGAELRFPADVTAEERQQRVDEVIGELGLTARADTIIDRLSGGQRKRTSVALELLTKPALLFLDEPTSGLDPGYEKAVMELLRQLADGGRAIVVVTHSVLLLERCDRVLFLAPGGVPAFLGVPGDALAHFAERDFADVFRDLETSGSDPRRYRPASRADALPDSAAPRPDVRPPPPPVPWMSQVSTLVRRQIVVIASDRRNLAILAANAVVIGLVIVALTGQGSLDPTRDGGRNARTLLGALVTSAAVLGAANTLREVVKDGAIYSRERAGGLDPVAYLASKMIVFGVITSIQITALVAIAVLRSGGPTTAIGPFPPLVELIGDVALTGLAAAALGLAISAIVSNSEKAMALIAVVFIFSWLFSGASVDLQTKPVIRELSYLTSANWGFAAAASSVNLRELDPNSCEPPPSAPSEGSRSISSPAPACDARWRHDVLQWSSNVAFLIVLTLVHLAVAMQALSRKDPIRAPTVLTPITRRMLTTARMRLRSLRT